MTIGARQTCQGKGIGKEFDTKRFVINFKSEKNDEYNKIFKSGIERENI